MVSIIDRAAYLQILSSQPVIMAFHGLLYGLNNTPDSGNNSQHIETDQIYFDLIRALQEGKKRDFQAAYARISRRTVTKNSTAPFLHNDYLIFVLVTGILKFNIEQAWIKSVMQARAKNRTTQTFEQLLIGDYHSKSGHTEMIFAYLSLTNPQKLTKDIQETAYRSVTQNHNLLGDGNDLIILCSLFTYDTIIMKSEPSERAREDELMKFEQRFIKRCGISAVVLYNAAILALVYLIWKEANRFPALKDNAGTISGIVGILGVSLGNFLTKVRDIIKSLIMLIWGYQY